MAHTCLRASSGDSALLLKRPHPLEAYDDPVRLSAKKNAPSPRLASRSAAEAGRLRAEAPRLWPSSSDFLCLLRRLQPPEAPEKPSPRRRRPPLPQLWSACAPKGPAAVDAKKKGSSEAAGAQGGEGGT